MNVTNEALRDTHETMVSYLKPEETRALSTTCRYFREFMQTEGVLRTLLATQYPLYRPLCDGRGVAALSARSSYEIMTAANCRAPGVVCNHDFKIERSNGHKFPLTPDGKKIIVEVTTPEGEERIGLYELDTGRCVWTCPLASNLRTLQISSNTLFVARIEGGDHSVDCVDLETGRILQTIEGDFDSFPTCIQSFDEKNVYMGQGFSSVVQRFSIETGRRVNTFNEPRVGRIGQRVLTLFQNGTKAISILGTGNMLVWEVEDGRTLQVLTQSPAHSPLDPPRLLQVSLDGTKAVSLWNDREIHVWDLTTGQLLTTSYLNIFRTKIACIQVTPDLKRACVGCANGNIMLIDLEKGLCLITFKETDLEIRGLQITPDGTSIISRTWIEVDSTIRVFNFQLPEERLRCAAEAPSTDKLPKFAQDEIEGLGPTSNLSERIHIYSATKVSLPTIRGFLEQALLEPESAALLARDAMARLKNLPPAIRDAVRWDLLQSSSRETPSAQQIREGIAAIDQAIAGFSARLPARRPIPEGKQE